MSMQPQPLTVPSPQVTPTSGGQGALVVTQPAGAADEDVAPSQAMEIWLFVIMSASLVVSISGLAFVYGFSLTNVFSFTNVSPLVRGTIVDSIMFIGVYFTRRFLMFRQKTGWHKRWGFIWGVIALAATAMSWFSNTLAVTAMGTIVTQDLLDKAGFVGWNAARVNQIIAALPMVAVLLYGIVPRRLKAAPQVVDTRTLEEMRADWEREKMRKQIEREQRLWEAENRAESLGGSLGTGVAAGLRSLNTAMGRDQSKKEAEEAVIEQMRALLIRHGWASRKDAARMKPRDVRLEVEARNLWDPATNQPTPKAMELTAAEQRAKLQSEAIARGWLTEEDISQEEEMTPHHIEARYTALQVRLDQTLLDEQQARQRSEEERLRNQPSEANTGHSAQIQDGGIAGNPNGNPQQSGLADTPGAESVLPQKGTYEGWPTIQEVAEDFGLTVDAIKYWMKAEAKPPKRIEQGECVRLVSNGKSTILIDPAAVLRIKRARKEPKGDGQAESSRAKKRDSNPRLAALGASTNHQQKGDVVLAEIARGTGTK